PPSLGAADCGRRTMKVVPKPTSERTSNRPSALSAKPRTIARPRPVPCPAGFVVKNGSKILPRWSAGRTSHRLAGAHPGQPPEAPAERQDRGAAEDRPDADERRRQQRPERRHRQDDQAGDDPEDADQREDPLPRDLAPDPEGGVELHHA